MSSTRGVRVVPTDHTSDERNRTASYSGYIDAHIGSNNPYTAYWGDNVCKLSQIKKRYDPDNSFTNPFQIGPTPPPGVKC